jgi:RND family efflux transporter MFP subunit
MLLRILLPLVILSLGYGGWKWLGRPVEEPKPQRQPPQRLKTERLELQRTRFPVELDSQGVVRAHHSATLTAQVSGTVVTVHGGFEDGAFFEEGDILLELDPADAKAAVLAAESRMARAEAALAQEEARAKQARLNWEDIGYKEEPSPLVLREPQLKEARANVTAATAELDQARRNLERTRVRAPFAGRVKSRMVGLGQSVGPTTPLGEIFATDYAEVRLPLAPSQLDFIRLPAREGDPTLAVTLIDALDRGEAPLTWDARVVRTEGALDEASRELFAIARIEDPFGLVSGKPELRLGQPVRARIEGVVLEDVFVLPRNSLRGVNRIYLIDPEEKTIRRAEIEPVWSTLDTLIVREGLAPGDWLATSRLPYAITGAPVDIIEAPQSAEAPNPKLSSAPSGS